MKRKIVSCLGIVVLAIGLLIVVLIGPGYINFYFVQNGPFDRAVSGTTKQAEKEIEKLLAGKSCEERKLYLISQSFKKIDAKDPNNYFPDNYGEFYEYVIYDYFSFISISSARIQFNIIDKDKCVHRVNMEGI
jgi:hypothetical protein